MRPPSGRSLLVVAIAALVATGASGCGGDADPAATESPAAPTTTTATSTPSARPTPAATATTAPATTPAPARSPAATREAGPDENGEFEGQLIVDYPGKPLKRTTSTTPNPDVETLQIRLGEVGYRVDTDGVFDAGTEAVVIAFQRDNGLTPDGVVGEATWAALFTFEG